MTIEKSESTINLWAAVLKMKEVLKGFTATTDNPALKKQGRVYKYAPLPEMQEVLNNILPQYGLMFTAGPCDTGVMYGLIHNSGEYEYRWVKMPAVQNVNEYKGYNTAIVRYGLGLMLNLPTDEDIDNADITHPEVMEKIKTEKQAERLKNTDEKEWLNILSKEGKLIPGKWEEFKKNYKGEKTIAAVNEVYNLSKPTVEYLRSTGVN
mgnify:FL=1